MITAVRRSSDGLLADIQRAPHFPANVTGRIQNAINRFGGTSADWRVFEVPNDLWQQLAPNPRARQLTNVDGNKIISISQTTPPVVTAPGGVSQIESDGVDTITLDVNVGDEADTDAVAYRVIAPDGTQVIDAEDAVDGQITLELTTLQLGAHRVIVETEAHGIAIFEFEGV